MEIINATRMLAGCTMALESSGRELLVLVVKGTFDIPALSGGRLALAEKQVPLVMSDQFFGEPGLSAPKYEIDFSARKHRCDVLLNGTAYAPEGRPTERVTVGLQVGAWSKSFCVVGDRVWFTADGIRATAPVPFTEMPITYDHAFGGTDLKHEDPAQHAAFMANPSGRGFLKSLAADGLDGSPLPNTEELDVPVEQPGGTYRPMAFGSIARHWEPRFRYAGTYDQDWLDNVFPFLPADFEEQYYQAAPLDQQIAQLSGDQQVTLNNLTPDGFRSFTLPNFEAPVCIFPKQGKREDLIARADTVMIEPDLQRVTMTWRVTRPLKKNIFEIAQVLVGRKGIEWWQRRASVTFPIPIVAESPRRRDPSPEVTA
jgi:hypothetical protein